MADLTRAELDELRRAVEAWQEGRFPSNALWIKLITAAPRLIEMAERVVREDEGHDDGVA